MATDPSAGDSTAEAGTSPCPGLGAGLAGIVGDIISGCWDILWVHTPPLTLLKKQPFAEGPKPRLGSGTPY